MLLAFDLTKYFLFMKKIYINILPWKIIPMKMIQIELQLIIIQVQNYPNKNWCTEVW